MDGRMLMFPIPLALMLTLTLAIVTREMREREFFRHMEAINIDSILINRRLIDIYIKCLLKAGKCDPTMKDLRMSLPLILEHLCQTRCSERERRNLRKLFLYIRTNRPLEWERLSKLYDPKGRYKANVDAFIDQKPRPIIMTISNPTSTSTTVSTASTIMITSPRLLMMSNTTR